MGQYLLAPYREYAVPLSPEPTLQAWGGVNASGDKLTDAGAFVFKSGLIPAESVTVTRLSKERAS